MSRPITLGELRDIVSTTLKKIFPELWPDQVLDFGALRQIRGRTLLQVELPVVTYSLSLKPHLERVVDYETRKNLETYTATIEETVPYVVRLSLGCSSDSQEEAEELAMRVHRALGRAPCLGGIGFHLVDSVYGGAYELDGVYSYIFAWEGWIRLAGPRQEVPLIRQIQIVPHIDTEVRLEPPAEAGTSPEGSAPPVEWKPLPEDAFDPGASGDER